MSYREIRYEVADGIATLTLYRPDKLNAFTRVMRDELVDAFAKADADDEVRAVIVTGAGRAFCAGADLSAGRETFDYAKRDGLNAQTHRDGGGQVTLRIFEMKKPVIAAVNGPAVGIGSTMLLPMDIRIASTEARFGFVFTRRGIVPEACSSWFLPRLVGIGQALEWTITGRVFPAQEALEGKLVSKVLPPEELLPAARALAKEIVESTAPVSVALTRQMLWRMLGADHPREAHKVDSRGIFHLGASPDVAEGVMAFKEKRAPKFGMRVSRDMPPFYPWWEDRPSK
jgi:enoyl-CoA hydratase/carnithine racemase